MRIPDYIQMKFFIILAVSLMLILASQLSSKGQSAELISPDEAALLVKAQETAKERAKNEREAKLLGAQIIESAVADLGYKKIMFNLVEKEPDSESTGIAEANPSEDPSPQTTITPLIEIGERKEHRSIALFGTVFEGSMSEIRWQKDDEQFRIFTNANFLYFSGMSEVEGETTQYSVFAMISEHRAESSNSPQSWRPSVSDFTPNSVEYFIMDWGSHPEPRDEDFHVINTILEHYIANVDTMKIDYENTKTLREARAAYLKMNPPKERDVIVNYRLFDTTASSN